MYKCVNKIKTVFLSLVAFSILPMKAQQPRPTSSGAPRQYMNTMHAFQEFRKLLNKEIKDNPISLEDIKGSPYMDDKFKLGSIFVNDSLIEKSLIRYNIYSDEIEIKENNELFSLLKIDNSSVIINEQKITYRKYLTDSGKIEGGYFVLLFKGEFLNLYKKLRCKLSSPIKAPTPNQKNRAAKFLTYTDYYVKFNEKSKFKKIKSKQKFILELMNDRKDVIKKLIQEEKIDFKKENDLISIFKEYNNLNI